MRNFRECKTFAIACNKKTFYAPPSLISAVLLLTKKVGVWENLHWKTLLHLYNRIVCPSLALLHSSRELSWIFLLTSRNFCLLLLLVDELTIALLKSFMLECNSKKKIKDSPLFPYLARNQLHSLTFCILSKVSWRWNACITFL